MSDVVIYKDESGKLAGFGEKGARAYARFLKAVRALEVGSTLKFSWWAPRSPGFHRRHFKILDKVFKHQDKFITDETFREWAQVGAEFCDIFPGPYGIPVAIARSIAWEELDDAEFAEHHAAVIGFLRSCHATRFLWPWLNDLQADAMMDSLLREFM